MMFETSLKKEGGNETTLLVRKGSIVSVFF